MCRFRLHGYATRTASCAEAAHGLSAVIAGLVWAECTLPSVMRGLDPRIYDEAPAKESLT